VRVSWRRLAGAALRRPLSRGLLLLAATMGGWYGWSPGTSFGLEGLLGGWLHASVHLLDAGLVPIGLAAALVGSTTREQVIDEALRASGVGRPTLVTAVAGGGSLVGLATMGIFALGAAGGGLIRAWGRGSSWWVDLAAVGSPGRVVAANVRLGLAVGLLGAGLALVGWMAARDDLAALLVVLLTVPYLEQSAAMLSRVPGVVATLAFSPVGTLRVVALANRGLAAPGYEVQATVWPFAVALGGWLAAATVRALPSGRRWAPSVRPSDMTGSVSTPVLVVVTTVVLAATLVFGATVPASVSGTLPWRWQRSWRDAHHDGWASDQVVDRLLGQLRAGEVADADLLTVPDLVPPAVADAVRRADRVERQPLTAMRGPDSVEVRLHFDQPVLSGVTAFTAFGLRFGLTEGADGHWRVAAVEGPVAVDARARGEGS
jgi:hypothetical protein